MSLEIGQQLGSYEITSLLGKGGMGEVYRQPTVDWIHVGTRRQCICQLLLRGT